MGRKRRLHKRGGWINSRRTYTNMVCMPGTTINILYTTHYWSVTTCLACLKKRPIGGIDK